MATETFTFHGTDGWAGFRRNHHQPLTYELTYERLEDGQVSIEMNHMKESDGTPKTGLGPLVITEAQFKEVFVKAK